jgi:hypothetical protein
VDSPHVGETWWFSFPRPRNMSGQRVTILRFYMDHIGRIAVMVGTGAYSLRKTRDYLLTSADDGAAGPRLADPIYAIHAPIHIRPGDFPTLSAPAGVAVWELRAVGQMRERGSRMTRCRQRMISGSEPR